MPWENVTRKGFDVSALLAHFPEVQGCMLSLPAIWSSMQALALYLLLKCPENRSSIIWKWHVLIEPCIK